MKRLITILLGATLVGCAGQTPKVNGILLSDEPKPNWVLEHKLENSTHLFFTGVSTKYAEERKAFKDAKYDALAKFLDYCGLHIKLHEKYISYVHGSTANVLSATNRIKTQLEINAEAQVGQFRIIKKHLEVYSGTRGNFYKVYVFASVPKNEVAQVKAWQKENDLQKIVKLKSLNDKQSQIIVQTKEELNGVQKQLEQLTFLRNRVTTLSSENNKLIAENKQLKEVFYNDKETKEALTTRVNELSIKGTRDKETIDRLTKEVTLLKVDNSKVASLKWERDQWHKMYLNAMNTKPYGVQAIIKWLSD
tara:strand:- start:972 stop:1892 length:921 start_codon:yes stop_codon:yes gene_type:complete